MPQIECRSCPLFLTRNKIVRGKGKMKPDFLFIGEAPGKDEDYDGFPFTGSSGKLLDLLLEKAQERINCKLKFYFTNTVWCRPTDSVYGNNRQPSRFEVFKCRPNIVSLVQRIRPKKIILIGETAKQYYEDYFKCLYTINHPAYILRKGGEYSSTFSNNLDRLVNIFKDYLYEDQIK